MLLGRLGHKLSFKPGRCCPAARIACTTRQKHISLTPSNTCDLEDLPLKPQASGLQSPQTPKPSEPISQKCRGLPPSRAGPLDLLAGSARAAMEAAAARGLRPGTHEGVVRCC